MPEENKFENILKSLRVRKGKAWTQAKVASELGVSRRLYVGWENGDSLPSQHDLKNIAALFGLSGEDEDALYRAAAQVSPRIHNLPFPPNPFFTGREKPLEQLSTLLNEGSNVAISQPVSVSGLGGIGKTQLALEYAHRCYREKIYRAVLWVDAAERRTIEASYFALAHLLDLPEQQVSEPERVVLAVKHWLETHTNWLLIMDNADDLALARSFFPVAHHGRILLTTRSQIVGKIARRVDIDSLTPAEGLRFLLLRSGVAHDDTWLATVSEEDREAARQLVELLGGHPLALDQAGAYIEDTGASFAEYIRLFQEQRHLILSKRGSLEKEQSSEHPESAATAIVMSVKKANKRHPMAAAILIFCAFLQPDAIPEELFQFHLAFQEDTIAFHEGISTLLRYSLIRHNRVEKTYAIHRLVQAEVAGMFPPEDQKRWRYWVMWAIGTALPRNMNNFKHWRMYERLLPHALLCVTWEDVDIRGIHDLLWRLALYLDTRGRSTEAEPLLARTLAVTEQHYGPDHPETAGALKNLADFYFKRRGREEEGKRMLERALAILEKNPGNDPLAVSRILSSLSQLHEEHGEYEEAERLKLRVIAEMEQHWGADHPDVAKSLGALATFYVERGQYEQAAPVFLRAEKIFEQQIALGKIDAQDPYIHLSMGVGSILLHFMGRDEEAEDYFVQMLRAKERLLGPEHPEVIEAKRSAISSLRYFGRHAEAEAFEAEIRAVEAGEEPSK